MTIGGAIAELQNLLDADDVPFYYKGGIKKVIETIQMEFADRKDEPLQYKIPNILPVPDPCKNCSNHPSNGGTGICHCTLASPKIT